MTGYIKAPCPMTWEPVVIERDEEDTFVTFGSWITVGELIEGLRKLPPDNMLAFSDSTYFGEDPDDGAMELPDDDHLDFVTTITLAGPGSQDYHPEGLSEPGSSTGRLKPANSSGKGPSHSSGERHAGKRV